MRRPGARLKKERKKERNTWLNSYRPRTLPPFFLKKKTLLLLLIFAAPILFPRQFFRSPGVFNKLWPLIWDSSLVSQTTQKPTLDVAEDSAIQSDLGFSFCAAGLLFPYYIGVGEAFRSRSLSLSVLPSYSSPNVRRYINVATSCKVASQNV